MRKQPFQYYLLASILFLSFTVVIGITIVDYLDAKDNFQKNSEFLRSQTENNIEKELKIVDDGLKLFDSTLNNQMKQGFTLFFDEYDRAEKNLSRMNLQGVKDQLDGKMDLYIINEFGVIEYTTFLPDQGLDFKKIPYFYEYLTRIRQSEGFFPDRIVREPATGILRKYAYMPTSDHKYIFELGLTGSEFEKERSTLRYEEGLKAVASLNPNVENIRIFTTRKQLEGDPTYTPDPNVQAILDTAIKERRSLEITNVSEGKTIRYLYVDLRDVDYGSDLSRIVELTYTNVLMQKALDNLLLYHLIIALIALILSAGFALVASRQMIKPIGEITRDIDTIAKGDLTHAVSLPKKLFAYKSRFSYYILVYLVILILFIVIGITAIAYMNADKNFHDNANLLQHQTEGGIVQAIQFSDTGFKLLDDSLNKQMKEGLSVLYQEYDRVGKDPSKIDLKSFKQRLGGSEELYIINESGVIEYTTYNPDRGLDFKKIPYFYEYLNRIRQLEGFFPDRVVRELSTGQFKKFAYMPSSDHKYILEIGVTNELIARQHDILPTQNIIHESATFNPYVTGIRIFNSFGALDEDYSFTPDEDLRQILDTILTKREGTQVDDPSAGKTIKYLFIDLRDTDYGSDVSKIVELTYNSKLINDALRELIVFHMFVAIGAMILSFGFAVIISRSLTKPIREIVSDVDAIAKGDLDHKVRISMANEFVTMEQSINTMVEKLKASIDKLTESEAKLKKSEEQLRESEKKYKVLVGLLPQLVYEIDTQGRFTFINRYAFDTLGYTPEDLEKGVTVSDVLIPEDRSRVFENIHRILNGEKIGGYEYTILKKDGTQVKVLAYSTPIIDDGKAIGLRGVLVDITKLKQIEGEIRQLNEELERRVMERTTELEAANREMEAFTYSVSHDLRAPLRALDGYSSILLKESHQHLTENDNRYLELIRSNAQQMAKLIDDLLNFSRSGRVVLNKEVVKPIFLVQKALDDLSEERKGRDVEIQLHSLPRTYADPLMLQQVFNNLLSNALKFTRKREHAKIEVGALERENQTIYYVRDNGVGFDMQYADKLFKVFQRFHSPQEYEGTGVGLAIVHRIIQRHGGTIWVESEVDKGTTFYFTI